MIIAQLLMTVGVFFSGLRDVHVSPGLPYGNRPWPKINRTH